MAKFHVPMWRTVEVIESGFFEVEADTAEAAEAAAFDRLKLGDLPQGLKDGDTGGSHAWNVNPPQKIE